MNKKLLEIADDLWVFQELADHLEDLIESPYYLSDNIEKLKGSPDSAKNIIYLWHFYCKVSSSGSLMDYIYNNDYITNEHTIKNLKAIKDIEYFDMLEKYKSAIKLSLLETPGTSDLDLKEFELFEIDRKYSDFNMIDEGLFDQISEQLPKYIAKYIRAHSNELFE